MASLAALGLALQDARGALFPWSPVLLGIGIGGYFALRVEPEIWVIWGLAGLALAVFALAFGLRGRARALVLTGAGLIIAGFALAGARAHQVAAPVLDWRYYGPVEGRVIGMDRSGSDALRLTLDQVRLTRMDPGEMPARVRISLHGEAARGPPPDAGARVMTTAHLLPPNGPVEPSGFDFQRHAWFLRLGGLGYTRVPVLGAGPPDLSGARPRIFATRRAVSAHMQGALPGDTGGFAAAVTAGDRSGMGQGALEALRASNLAHLLAISGLHMGLLTGVVFTALRLGLALVPGAALALPLRRIAASGALAAGAVYLLLSGGSVATERAFIMAAVALVAVMLDRQMLSLHAVAVAALVVLALRPEALLSPGFQMSFAATTALVAVFGALRDRGPETLRLPRALRPVSALVISSAVAGLATMPFAAAHFNGIAHYGLLANLLSVPVMGTVVVPAAVLAAVLAPFGLDGAALWVMGLGLDWILWVAHWVAALPGARSFVPGPGVWVLPIFSLGALVLILWPGRPRWAGLAMMLGALGLWAQTPRPDVLIADNGALVGVMTDQGRALSRAKGAGFIARNWLENDGERVPQTTAFARWEAEAPQILHVTGKRASGAVTGCGPGLIVSNQKLADPIKNACDVFDSGRLRRTGSVALFRLKDGAFRMITAREHTGSRLWTRWPDAPEPTRRKDQYVRISPTKRP